MELQCGLYLDGLVEEKEAGILSAPAWTDDDMVVVLIWASLQLNISMESNCVALMMMF